MKLEHNQLSIILIFLPLPGANDDVMIKVFMIGVVVILCVVGAAMNPQILGNISLPDVSLTNTYHLTLMSCVAASMLNLGYFLSALSKMMREFEERTQIFSQYSSWDTDHSVN